MGLQRNVLHLNNVVRANQRELESLREQVTPASMLHFSLPGHFEIPAKHGGCLLDFFRMELRSSSIQCKCTAFMIYKSRQLDQVHVKF